MSNTQTPLEIVQRLVAADALRCTRGSGGYISKLYATDEAAEDLQKIGVTTLKKLTPEEKNKLGIQDAFDNFARRVGGHGGFTGILGGFKGLQQALEGIQDMKFSPERIPPTHAERFIDSDSYGGGTGYGGRG